MFFRFPLVLIVPLVCGTPLFAWSGQQTPTPAQASSHKPQAPGPAEPETKGTVLFQSHGEPPPPQAEPLDPHRKPLTVPPLQATGDQADRAKGPELSDRE